MVTQPLWRNRLARCTYRHKEMRRLWVRASPGAKFWTFLNLSLSSWRHICWSLPRSRSAIIAKCLKSILKISVSRFCGVLLSSAKLPSRYWLHFDAFVALKGYYWAHREQLSNAFSNFCIFLIQFRFRLKILFLSSKAKVFGDFRTVWLDQMVPGNL